MQRPEERKTQPFWLAAGTLAALTIAAGVSLLFSGPEAVGQQPSVVTLELDRAMSRAARAERIPVLIEVGRANPPSPLSVARDLRAAEHAADLAGLYAATVDDLRRNLPDEFYFDLQAGELLWIGGALTAELTSEQIRKLDGQSGVQRLYYDGLIQVELAGAADPEPLFLWAPGLPPVQGTAPLPWGLEAIGAPEVWAAGATGEGTVIATIDSGVDGNHPLLWRKWRGLTTSPSQAWFDPWGLTEVPVDDNHTGGIGHGTIVMSSALGSLEPGDTLLVLGQLQVIQDELEFVTGVAPDAQWVAANGFEQFGGDDYTRLSVLLQAMQWVLDPDGDPTTVSDVPDVLNNSWGFRTDGCGGVFDRAIDALELSGVPVVFAAGNRSAGFDTVATPADRADLLLNSFAVGATQLVDGRIEVAPNSLGGPSPCAPGAVKPEVVAPGDIPLVNGVSPQTARLLGPSGAFTSWAAPYVSGSLAVLAGLNPSAISNDLKSALFSTATDMDPPGLDNRSGAGFINLVAAAEAIGGLGGVQLALNGWDWNDEAATLTLRLYNAGNSPFPGGTAELTRGRAGELLGRAEAPLIGARRGGQIVFDDLPGASVEEDGLNLLLESDGARLVFPVVLLAPTPSTAILRDGSVLFSLDANGRLGTVTGSPGLIFLGRSWLTGGGFLFASGGRVSDGAYVDVLQQPSLKTNPVGSDTDWRAISTTAETSSAVLTYSDDRALRTTGASVRQSVELVEVSDSAAFVAITVSVDFRTDDPVPLAGLFLDWDFGNADFVRWESELGASVMVPADSSGPWFAVTTAPQSPTTHAAVPLGTPANSFYVAGTNNGILARLEGFTDEEKGRLLALGGMQVSDDHVTDWAHMVGVGPLQSGDTTVFLIAAGGTRAHLQAALDSARAFARQNAASGAVAVGSDLVLLPPYPNPFDPTLGETLKLPFLVNRGSEPLSAMVEIFTIDGWPVYSETRDLAPDLPVEPFRWSGLLDGGEAAATGVYGYVIKVGGRVKSGKFVLLK